MKKIIILLNILCLSACESYNIRPEILNDNSKINAREASSLILHYNITHSLYTRFENEFLRKSLSELPFRKIVEVTTRPQAGMFLEVDINYLRPSGLGLGIITVITLGIIPTYFKEIDEYSFCYKLSLNDNFIASKTYILRLKQFNWILVAPAGFGNRYRERKQISKMTRDFFSEIDLSKLERKVPAASP